MPIKVRKNLLSQNSRHVYNTTYAGYCEAHVLRLIKNKTRNNGYTTSLQLPKKTGSELQPRARGRVGRVTTRKLSATPPLLRERSSNVLAIGSIKPAPLLGGGCAPYLVYGRKSRKRKKITTMYTTHLRGSTNLRTWRKRSSRDIVPGILRKRRVEKTPRPLIFLKVSH